MLLKFRKALSPKSRVLRARAQGVIVARAVIAADAVRAAREAMIVALNSHRRCSVSAASLV